MFFIYIFLVFQYVFIYYLFVFQYFLIPAFDCLTVSCFWFDWSPTLMQKLFTVMLVIHAVINNQWLCPHGYQHIIQRNIEKSESFKNKSNTFFSSTYIKNFQISELAFHSFNPCKDWYAKAITIYHYCRLLEISENPTNKPLKRLPKVKYKVFSDFCSVFTLLPFAVAFDT